MAKVKPSTPQITCSVMRAIPKSTTIPLAQIIPMTASEAPSQGVNARAIFDDGTGAFSDVFGTWSISKYPFP